MPNPNHLPAGSSKGGEFAPKSGSELSARRAAGVMTGKDKYQERIQKKYPNLSLPIRRPDGLPITIDPDKNSDRRGLVVGQRARGNYSPTNGEFKTVSGEIIGFVHNSKREPGGSTGDVVIFNADSGTVYFVASRNVFKQGRK